MSDEQLAADAPPGDTYGREQAARVLGVSPRRVSQLVESGRLVVAQEKPLRVTAESVNTLRAERREKPNATSGAKTPPDSVAEQVTRIVEMLKAEQRLALEAGESLLHEVQSQRDEYRDTAERLRSQVDELRAQLDAAQSRKWWKR